MSWVVVAMRVSPRVVLALGSEERKTSPVMPFLLETCCQGLLGLRKTSGSTSQKPRLSTKTRMSACWPGVTSWVMSSLAPRKEALPALVPLTKTVALVETRLISRKMRRPCQLAGMSAGRRSQA